MPPKQALELFATWSREVVAIKHIDTFNQAYVALAKLIEDATPKPPEKPA